MRWGALRVRAYIDGLNLFYGSLKGHPERKWLDIVGMVEALRPGDSIELIRYFTARVSGKFDPGCPQRLDAYFRALRGTYSIARLTIQYGRFRSHPVEMPLAVPPPHGSRMVTVVKTEEKGSDVNLASYLLVDGFDGLYDLALVISNDSDLVEPIRMANARFAPVHVVRPNSKYLQEMDSVAASYTSIPSGIFSANQLPPSVRLANGKTVTRPTDWTPRAAD